MTKLTCDQSALALGGHLEESVMTEKQGECLEVAFKASGQCSV